MADFYGPNAPFFGGPEKVLSRQEDEKLIRNDILQLLLTLPGERVMMPEFGTMIRGVLFENDNDELVVALESDIRDKLGIYEPRVLLEVVTVTPSAERQQYLVQIIGRLKKNPRQEIIVERFIGAPRTPR